MGKLPNMCMTVLAVWVDIYCRCWWSLALGLYFSTIKLGLLYRELANYWESIPSIDQQWIFLAKQVSQFSCHFFPKIANFLPFHVHLGAAGFPWNWTAGSATASSGESRGYRLSELDCQHQHVPWIADELLGWLGVTVYQIPWKTACIHGISRSWIVMFPNVVYGMLWYTHVIPYDHQPTGFWTLLMSRWSSKRWGMNHGKWGNTNFGSGSL